MVVDFTKICMLSDHDHVACIFHNTTMQKEVRPVKLNAAAILREGARVQREEDEQEKRSAVAFSPLDPF